jgi:hypothetical protein
MGNEDKTNNKHGGSGPPEGAIPAPDQRRNRGGEPGGKTSADEQRRTVAESDTSGGSPMDPQDEEFLKKSQ